MYRRMNQLKVKKDSPTQLVPREQGVVIKCDIEAKHHPKAIR